jgi:hypothetical protein
MNIKDYLHLYLPFQAMIVVDKYGEENPTLIEVNKVDVWLREIWDEDGFSWNYRSIKPILRPLSSMTEDEAKEGGFWSELHNCITGTNTSDAIYDMYSASKFLWSLSKHFDLFGLIEKGLAIDASTIKV